MDKLQALIDPAVLQLIPCNTAALDLEHSTDSVNDGCGSDFVQTQRKWPASVLNAVVDAEAQLCCAVDGDADRIVFMCPPPGADASVDEHEVLVLDGDYIAALFARYLQQQLAAAQLSDTLSVGVLARFCPLMLCIQRRSEALCSTPTPCM